MSIKKSIFSDISDEIFNHVVNTICLVSNIPPADITVNYDSKMIIIQDLKGDSKNYLEACNVLDDLGAEYKSYSE